MVEQNGMLRQESLFQLLLADSAARAYDFLMRLYVLNFPPNATMSRNATLGSILEEAQTVEVHIFDSLQNWKSHSLYRPSDGDIRHLIIKGQPKTAQQTNKASTGAGGSPFCRCKRKLVRILENTVIACTWMSVPTCFEITFLGSIPLDTTA